MLFSDLNVCIFPVIDPSEKATILARVLRMKNSGLNPSVRIPSNLSVSRYPESEKQ